MTDLVDALAADEGVLVDDIIGLMLSARPDLYDRYSAAAPKRTREDVAFHLQHLRGALVAEDPLIFHTYYRWLLEVLLPRGIAQEDIDLNFDCMNEALARRYGDDAATCITYVEGARTAVHRV